MYKYFCNSCGYRFKSNLSERDENGILNEISCPHCGAWDIYPDTINGSRQAVKHLTEHENKLDLWDE